ncbi:MAG: GGDEF domain-containing protein [Acidobacteria bacterium]|nr:MAG: GGDEF domain-containing protein [Acidobacteriota bacterium]
MSDWSEHLRVLSAGTLKSLFVPGGIWLLGAVLLVYSGWLTVALPVLSFLYYCAIAAGMLLAWRFHSSRIFLSLSVVFLAQQAAAVSTGQPPFISATLTALAVLLPVNFVLIAMMHERGFTVESVAPVALFLFVESLTVTVFCGAAVRVHSLSIPIVLPRYALAVPATAAIFLSVRFLLNRKPLDSALLWSLASFFLALRSAAAIRTSTAYWLATACILATAVIENSYLLAYHDELTSLPSRRAFNDALLRLKAPYSIAVVDIDHFKRFNDTYGHDTGDQVLRMVATNLGSVTGGGKAYRCGGEEFNILFPGKTIAEVLPHLEKLRVTVAKSEFRMRGNDRRQLPRGPDRRNQRNRARARKGDAIRRLAEGKPSSVLSVTISIGVATAAAERSSPETVLESADKALYRAKANGRNRVETAASPQRRVRTRAAGIA